MATYTAILEEGDDGSWSAYTLSPSLIVGTGATKDAALADLRVAVSFWLDYMRDTGQPVPRVSTEVVSIEVAA
jgi:predicted RNase H-like HicB family nuclease